MHQGACHCGKITFEFDAKLDHAVYCNCSICAIRGTLWHGVAEHQLRIKTGEADLALYQFGTHTAKHYFCKHCGVAPFARPRVMPEAWVVNVRCVPGLDLASLPVQQFDGIHWEESAKAFLENKKARKA